MRTLNMSQNQTTNERQEAKNCWTCFYYRNRSSKSFGTFICENATARKELKKRGHEYIPRKLMDIGCSNWQSKRHYKPETKKKPVDNQKNMFG